MRELGLTGAVRGRAWVTTTHADPAADRPSDLVDRHFTATRPNQLWVADFTYVATLDWVDWFNHRRLLEPIGDVPPAEYEARYYQQAAVA